MANIKDAYYDKQGKISYLKLVLENGATYLFDSDEVEDAAEAVADIQNGEFDMPITFYGPDPQWQGDEWDVAHPEAVKIYPV